MAKGRAMAARAAPASLSRRLILLAAVWSVAVLVGAGFGLSAFFHQAALSRFDQGLTDTVDALYAGATVDENGTVSALTFADPRALRAYSGKYWEIAEPAGDDGVRQLVRSRSLWDAELILSPALVERIRESPGQGVPFDAVGPVAEPLRAVGMSATLPGRTDPVLFLAAEDRTPVDRDVRRFSFTTAGFLALLAAGLIGAVVVQVRVGLSPVYAMGREVARVRQGKAQRLSTEYPSELSPLAAELNALLAHNQEVVERQRTHVGNLAHALKTPVSVMLAEAERHPGPLAEVVGRQAEVLRNNVEHHLRRARAAARSTGLGERTEIAPVLDELTRALQRIFDEKVIDWDAPDELSFAGERQDLQEMAGNLIENACKWSRRKVRATAGPSDDPRFFDLTVEDDGPGLPPDRRDDVLKRGARLDESAPGSGLGLSIVDELARAYGGALDLSDSSLGGLKIALKLPRAEE